MAVSVLVLLKMAWQFSRPLFLAHLDKQTPLFGRSGVSSRSDLPEQDRKVRGQSLG